MLVKIANMGNPVQKQSDLGLYCLPRPFQQATGVQTFVTLMHQAAKT